ncbi:hypothetical protein E1212_13765 [Jiangella ureilytica]|uniref:Uncharacterized protein n=1 Tax=Jiangella ureilytica TaxID=2530374 RepID=A0A4R4RQR9_9ACTN|nr:hypothetical protein [Jiangella ureilytica]TDC50813.1 hypothetical protein E1212_13765 [Jiangella ureilytica]
MIDSVLAEIGYRREQVRRDVAAGRRTKGTNRAERTARMTEDHPAAGRRATRRPRPAVQYARPRAVSAGPQPGGRVC